MIQVTKEIRGLPGEKGVKSSVSLTTLAEYSHAHLCRHVLLVFTLPTSSNHLWWHIRPLQGPTKQFCPVLILWCSPIQYQHSSSLPESFSSMLFLDAPFSFLPPLLVYVPLFYGKGPANFPILIHRGGVGHPWEILSYYSDGSCE